jgi:hypothetical protein
VEWFNLESIGDKKITFFKGSVELWNSLPVNLSFAEAVDLLVSPDHAGHVQRYLDCSGLPANVLVDNLQKEIDAENVPAPSQGDLEGLELRPGKLGDHLGFEK